MDSAEAPKEFSLEDPVIRRVRDWMHTNARVDFAERWLSRSPTPLTICTISYTEPSLKIHRHHLEMLIAHMRLQGKA